MYNIIKSILLNKNYILEDILNKIQIIQLQSDITDEQKEELCELARNNANTDNSINELSKLKEIDKRLKNLEDRISKLEEGEETTIPEEYPAYVIGKWYYNGDKCSENGKNYICIAPEGAVCVWSPSEYPEYWQEQTSLID